MENSLYTDKEKKAIEMYNDLNSTTSNIDWFIFMNHGFMPLDDDHYPIDVPEFKQLIDIHKGWRYQALLYMNLINTAEQPTDDCSILDISCGRGGGTSVYHHYYNFRRIVGLDLNENHIRLAKNKFSDFAEYYQGTYRDLPFIDEEFDFVTNLEASNYYDDPGMLFSESYRVLKSNGTMIFSDHCMGVIREEMLESEMKNSGFKIIKKRNITRNVRAACALDKYALDETDHIEAGNLAQIHLSGEEPYFLHLKTNLDFKPMKTEYYIYVLEKETV